MWNDEPALLAAITAAPADDAVRLAYADWLDEHGAAPRAEFIRAQVEAETLHRHAPRRQELERRADALLAEHWIDWWSPVCEAAGLPLPRRRGATRLGRLVQALRFEAYTGAPYTHGGCTIYNSRDRNPDVLEGLRTVTYRRGFPEVMSCVFDAPTDAAFLERWPVVPLSRVTLYNLRGGCWRDGPYLAGVSAVELNDYDQDGFAEFLRLPSLVSLDDLTLGDPAPHTGPFSPDLALLAESRFAPQLRRLSVAVWDAASAAALGGGFNSLTALEVSFEPEGGHTLPVDANTWLMMIAESRPFAGLRELDLVGGFTQGGLQVAASFAGWTNLRRLSLDFQFAEVGWVALPDPAHLPALEDLSLTGVSASPLLVESFVASPLLKELRHFAIDLWQADTLSGDDWRRLADAVDVARVETFFVNPDHTPPLGVHLLRQRLGDKLRTPW